MRLTRSYHRLGLAILVATGLLIVVLAPAASVQAQDPPVRISTLDIILLIDNSRSMSLLTESTQQPASDPDDLRIQAGRFLMDYLGVQSTVAGLNHRAGVANFGGRLGQTIPLSALLDDRVRDLIQEEVIDNTDFRPPLQWALNELRSKSFGFDRDMAVILFTDGRPWIDPDTEMTPKELDAYFDPENAEPDALATLLRELHENGVQVYVIAIGDAQEVVEENWTRLILAERYVSLDNMEQLADEYHRLLGDLLGVSSLAAGTLEPGQSADVHIDPFEDTVAHSHPHI